MKKRGVPSTNFCERLDREQLAQLALANAEELLKNLTGQYFRVRFKTSIEGSPKKRSQLRYWVLEPHKAPAPY